MRNIGKARLQRAAGYPSCAVARPVQERKGARQPQFADARGEGGADGFDQTLQIARRNPLTARHIGYTQSRLVEMNGEIAERSVEARMRDRAQAALAGRKMRGQRRRHEVVNVA